MLKPKETKKSKEISNPCGSKRILQAVSILKQLNQKYNENSKKKSLLDDETENPIILQITMKKIPPATMQKFIKVHLPKSMVTGKNEVCLITGDLDKRNTKAEVEPDVLHFKELLKKENISQVNEVITLRQLRKEYKPYEARRQLSGAYDIFLCDKRIAGVLPSTLGKTFFKKRKCPIQINMQTSKLKEQVENALSSTVFHITCKGNSCASEVANLSMSDEDILSNVMSSLDTLKEQLPGQWDNILGIYVKTRKSKAIPLYMSTDNPNDFNFGKKRARPKAVTAELSTLPNTEVKVFRDGRVIVKFKKNTEVKVFGDGRVIVKSKKKTGCDGSSSESEEENNVNDSIKDDEVNTDDTIALESQQKSKKRKSNLSSKEEICQVEAVKEETDTFEVENLKNKKRKSNDNSVKESSKIEEKEEAEKLGKKNKKRDSSASLNEESSAIELDVEVEITGKKSKKRKSHLSEIEEVTKVMVNEENVEVIKGNSKDFAESKKKSKKDAKKFIEEPIEIEHLEVEKLTKENKKRKSKLMQNEEIAEVKANEEIVDISEEPEKKKKKRKSEVGQNEEITEIKANEEIVDISKEPEKKNKNRKSKIGQNEEITEIKANEEIVAISEEPEKKKKKRKSKIGENEEIAEIKAIEEIVAISEEPEKKNKKRKSKIGQDEEITEIKANEEIVDIAEEPEKKKKKRKSKLLQNEEIIDIKANKETLDSSEIESQKKKSRKFNLNSENSEVVMVEENSKNSKVAKSDRKNKKSISNMASYEVSAEIKEKTSEQAPVEVKSLSLKRKHKRTLTQN